MTRASHSRSILARGIAAFLCLLVLSAPVAAQASVSQEQELRVGKSVAADLITQFGVVADPEWLAFLTQIRDRVLPFSGRPDVPYQLVILDTPIPNAISTPGYVFVTRGMLRLGLDSEGWAFVMAHEMAHTAKRHVAAYIERATAGMLFALIIAILTGDRTLVDVVRLLQDIVNLGFSRDKETEADVEALRMMVEAGFDPAKAAHTLAWFNEATGRRQERTHWAGTHPGFLDRVAAVDAAYAAFPSRGLPLRVWYYAHRQESGGLAVVPTRLVEISDAWILSLSLENATAAVGTVFAPQAMLSGPDGDLAVRFLRSTLPGEVAPQGKISGTLAFEKASSRQPAALLLPVLFSDDRVDLRTDLTGGGPYTPDSSLTPLPKPPAAPSPDPHPPSP